MQVVMKDFPVGDGVEYEEGNGRRTGGLKGGGEMNNVTSSTEKI